MATISKIRQSIQFLNNWKEKDYEELQGDKTSNYAIWVLENHKHIDVALEILETELDKRTYQE